MKKKVVKPLILATKPNGYGYALQEMKDDGSRVVIDSATFYKPIMESLRRNTLIALADGKKKRYSVVVYINQDKFEKNGIYDKEVVRLDTESFAKDRIKAFSYINCLEYLFDDRQLLEKVEHVAKDYYTRYNGNGNYREMLDVGELRELYRSVKNADWEQYKEICNQFDLRASLYAKDIFADEDVKKLAWE